MAERVFNDVQITSAFEVPQVRQALLSGETLGQLFGKIAKVINDLDISAFDGVPIYQNTTEEWNKQTSLIAEAGSIYIYLDYTFKDQNNEDCVVPNIKIGSGAYLLDTPFITTISDTQLSGISKIIFGNCATDAAETALVVTIADYTPAENDVLMITFTNDVPAGATLNINNTTAKVIQVNGSAIITDMIKAGNTACLLNSTDSYIFLAVSESANTKINKVDGVGSGSFSIGRKADTTVGQGSATLGLGCEAASAFAIAAGYQATAAGMGSIALGDTCNASAHAAFAANSGTTADGEGAAAFNASYAHGTNSFSEGLSTTDARADYAHAEGFYTLANGKYQHVQGKYNVADTSNKYADIVGGGTSGTARKNIYTLDWEGNGVFAGDVTATNLGSQVFYFTCSDTTAADTSKVLTYKRPLTSNRSIQVGDLIVVRFYATNTAENPTFKIDGVDFTISKISLLDSNVSARKEVPQDYIYGKEYEVVVYEVSQMGTTNSLTCLGRLTDTIASSSGFGMVKTTSAVTDKTDYTPAPIIDGVMYYKDTDTKYTLPTAGTELGGVKTTSTVTNITGFTACPIVEGVPYYYDHTYQIMTAATESANGKYGLVPSPAAGAQNKFLRGDGTWADVTATSCLPLAGGTMTGTIKSNAQYPLIVNDGDSKTYGFPLRVNKSDGTTMCNIATQHTNALNALLFQIYEPNDSSKYAYFNIYADPTTGYRMATNCTMPKNYSTGTVLYGNKATTVTLNYKPSAVLLYCEAVSTGGWAVMGLNASHLTSTGFTIPAGEADNSSAYCFSLKGGSYSPFLGSTVHYVAFK